MNRYAVRLENTLRFYVKNTLKRVDNVYNVLYNVIKMIKEILTREGKVSKRELQKFQGELRDRDLYLIEDSLDFYADGHKEKKGNCEKLVQKLYQDFHEVI